MKHQQLLKSGLRHILSSKVQEINKLKEKERKFSKFNLQLNKKNETIDSKTELVGIETLIDNL